MRDYAIYMLDPGGIIQSWNGGAEVIKGYAASEVIGKHYSMFFRQEDVLAGRPIQELQDALNHGRSEDEGWRCAQGWLDVLGQHHRRAHPRRGRHLARLRQGHSRHEASAASSANWSIR